MGGLKHKSKMHFFMHAYWFSVTKMSEENGNIFWEMEIWIVKH